MKTTSRTTKKAATTNASKLAAAYVPPGQHKALEKLAKSENRTLPDKCRQIFDDALSGKLKAKPAPLTLTLTIDGKLADTIREAAREQGVRPATFAKQCISFGDLCTAPTDEGRDFRLNLGRNELAKQEGEG